MAVTAEQVTQELQLLRAQMTEVMTRVHALEVTNRTQTKENKENKNLIMSKGLSGIQTYDGRADEFEDWIFKMRNWLESEDKDFGQFLKEIEAEDDEIDNEWVQKYDAIDAEKAKVSWMNQQLYHILAQKTSNSPLQTVKNLGDEMPCRGAAAWSNIVKVGRGRNTNRALVLTGKVHNPKRVEKFQDVLPAFEKWESYASRGTPGRRWRRSPR